MAKNTKTIKTPIGELRWVFITGDGSFNEMSGNDEYRVSVVLPKEKALPLIKEIKSFFVENFGEKAKPKSLGYKPEEDENGDETGNYIFTFKTRVYFNKKDGSKQKVVIRVFRANGEEITKQYHAKELLAANGSEGIVYGVMSPYEKNKMKGVSLYLQAVQFTKFKEYTPIANVEAVENADDGLEVVDDGLGVSDETTKKEDTPPFDTDEDIDI